MNAKTYILICPFLVEPLNRDDTSTPNDYPLCPLFPASYRTTSNDLAASTKDIDACVQKELNLHRLQIIFSRLWIVGRPIPPRPLHHQLLLSRDIFITEQMDMHLVWTSGRIFTKPIPRFLMPRFWTDHLSCLPCCICPRRQASSVSVTPVNECVCDRPRLWKLALGFLFSYAALVSHESDFAIAQEKKLILTELRLSRLKKIYRLTPSSFLHGYMSRWNRYGDFFQDNLGWLAAATVYIALVLTAMQVGLATVTIRLPQGV
ncbi:hypothetical protein N7463_004862 [Penicillium fimorum]|uniref:Uncharacterized protein n=1 Tax=Penicillium fimorum TaxID=1882269 RepID=A0A9W9XRG9_9EURO|nr:hypothetical protein N7463_004862 [Penicillium fimorum]